MAYMTVTFLLEAMSIANAVLATKTLQDNKVRRPRSPPPRRACPIILAHSQCTRLLTPVFLQDIDIQTIQSAISQSESEGDAPEHYRESSPLLINSDKKEPDEAYSLDRKVEIGELSELFLGRVGQGLFFLTIIVYLLGDLAIYATTIADALARVTGGWSLGKIYLDDTDAYYVYVLLVLVVVSPLGFLNFNSPYVKYLQFATMAIRNLALMLMISLTIDLIANRKGEAPHIPFFAPRVADFFGTAIYAFMCHHSLPGIITPMKNKLQVNKILGIDFILIATLYILLGVFATIAFGSDLSSLYIYKFKNFSIVPFAVFLQLFPVFTLSSNFPMLTITLRNNMVSLVKIIMGPERVARSAIMRDPPVWFRAFIFTLSALAPAFIISIFDNRNVTLLVRLTGSYPGLFIMFAFPAVLVFFARRQQKSTNMTDPASNPYRSWFQSNVWLILVAIWCVGALVLQTYNLVRSLLFSSYYPHPHSLA